MLLGVKVISMADTSGYAHAGRTLVRGLVQAGVPVTWTPLVRRYTPFAGHGYMHYEPFVGRSIGDREFDPLCNRPIAYDVVLANVTADLYPLCQRWEPGRPLIGYSAWETEHVPPGWLGLISGLAGLIVPTEWNRDTVLRAGYARPVSVVPHGLTRFPAPRPVHLPGVRPDDWVFYSIGLWDDRKGLDLLLRAYWDTFSATDPVALVIKTTRADKTQYRPGRLWYFFSSQLLTSRRAVRRLRQPYRRPARVVVITRKLSEAQMAGLHARGDCYASLTRGEGWGLGAFDAAAAGKPVVMTRCGGQMAFLREELSYLVDYRLAPVASPLHWFQVMGQWAEPDLAQASARLRHVYEHRQEAQERAGRLQAQVLAEYTPERVGASLVAALEHIVAP